MSPFSFQILYLKFVFHISTESVILHSEIFSYYTYIIFLLYNPFFLLEPQYLHVRFPSSIFQLSCFPSQFQSVFIFAVCIACIILFSLDFLGL